MTLLTIPEVADTLKVSERTVRRLIRSGSLAAYKLGDRGQVRIDEEDLVRYLEAQRIEVARPEADDDVTEAGE